MQVVKPKTPGSDGFADGIAPGIADRGSDDSPRRRIDRAGLLVVIGSFLAMIGILGDLLTHALSPATRANAGLFVLGVGNDPWHLVLLAGVVATAIGGVVWAARLSSDYGALIATAMVLALAFTLIAGAWAGYRGGQGPAGSAAGASGIAGAGSVGAAGAAGVSGAGHVHDATGATDLGETGASGLTGALAGEGTEGQAQFGEHQHGTPGPTTDLEARQTATMLAAAKRATAKYRDVRAAQADGYRQVTQFIPGLGLHLANLSLLRAGFDPVRPPVLLYEPTAGGGLRLAGVAYSLPAGDTSPVGFPGGDDVWHFHTNLCFLLTGDVTITPNSAACKAKHGVFQVRTAWLLHAWIWVTNPKGVFTESNPRVF